MGWQGTVWLGSVLAAGAHATAVFTLQVQSDSQESLPLVRHEEPWRYFEGQSEPPADWATRPEEQLPSGWQEAPGGFGYGDPGFPGEITPLPEMRHRFTSLYIRREWTVTELPAGEWRLQLTVDFDDGFVAYLDGIEVARSHVDGTPGDPVPFDGTAAGSHEGSCCDHPTSPPGVFDLGPAADRLPPGRHILALHGLNRAPDSSDFHLVADLQLVRPPAVLAGRYLAVSQTGRITLVGTNAVDGVRHLRLNGVPVPVPNPEGPWTATADLAPGWNRLLLEGTDDQGMVLATAGLDVIWKREVIQAPARLEGEVTWNFPGSVILVSGPMRLDPGTHLTVAAGSTVLFGPEGGIDATDAIVEVVGTEDSRIFMGPMDGTSPWAGITVTGAGSSLTVRDAEIVAGRLEVAGSAVGVIENTVIRDRETSGAIVHSDHAASVSLRRCRLARFHETLFQYSLVSIEDCLLEDFPGASSDGIDFDGGLPGSVIRRCTIRGGLQDNSDAIDIGSNSHGVLIEGCWLHHFTDKGVSIGEDSHGIVVTNCLIHHTGIGVEVKEASTAMVAQSTIADCQIGFRLQIKSGSEGGHLTNSFNNILWHNGETLVLQDDATILAHHSLMAGLPVAGEGNLDLDPGFRDPTAFDYRLPTDSPLRGAGWEGSGLGANLPVGAWILATQPRLSLSRQGTDLRLRFPYDPQTRYRIESAPQPEGPWTDDGFWTPPPWPDTAAIPIVPDGVRFYRVARLPETP